MDPVLRILDANLNRAREGVRTAEEYSRLCLEDTLCLELLRDVRRALAEFSGLLPEPARLLESRDVEHDPGLQPHSPTGRDTPGDVALAGLKRAQEALRVLEEYAKPLAARAAALAAKARYLLYTGEQQLFVAAPRRKALRDARVMVIFTRALCRGPWQETLRALLDAGARLFQLREKDAEGRDLCEFGEQFMGQAGAESCVLVNDRADVCCALRAAGVHVGQRDLPLQAARIVVGHGALVGVSTHNMEEAAQAAKGGADYIGLGAMFPTGSKNVESFALPQVVAEVHETLPGFPVFCIGGVTSGNAARLRPLGVKRVAAGAALLQAEQPGEAFRALVAALEA
ncbi:MAG: thiamine phosphate synthase [Planctomycetes bacterium]|nr:thiamine phosphate synthase [Planctomycetota bacterium]